MQRLPLRRKSLENTLSFARRYHGAGEAQIDLLPPLDVILIAGGQRRHRLEAPFLVWDTSKGVVSIVDDLSLPARLHLLPRRPCFGGPGGALVGICSTLWRSLGLEAFCVEQRSPRREREEVYSHGGGSSGGDWRPQLIIYRCDAPSTKRSCRQVDPSTAGVARRREKRES